MRQNGATLLAGFNAYRVEDPTEPLTLCLSQQLELTRIEPCTVAGGADIHFHLIDLALLE